MVKPTRMTRPQMEQEIIQGRSVVYKGRTYTRVQDLPSEAELARGDPEQEAQVAAGLQAQIDALRQQLADVHTRQATSGSPAGEPKGRTTKADGEPKRDGTPTN